MPPVRPAPPSVSPAVVSRTALMILAVVACGAVLYWLRNIFTPLALALFLAVLIDGLVRLIRKHWAWLPKKAALPTALTIALLGFIAAVLFIADNATAFALQLVDYTPKLNQLIAQGAAMVGMEVPLTVSQLFQQLNVTAFVRNLAGGLQGFASDSVFVLIYLGFLLASRRGWERKIVGLFPEREERQEAVEAFLRIRDGVEQYLWVQTITGMMIGLGSWIAMSVAGLSNAAFWAFLIFIASYIPIIGGIVGILLPPAFGLVEFDSYWRALALLAGLQAIQFVVGNIVQPRMQGRSLNMDPVAVLLSLAFWGALWGLPGMFLSTPLTVMAMVILAQFNGTRWIAVLLSEDGEPEKLRHRDSRIAPGEKLPADREAGEPGAKTRTGASK
ncbi:MAG: AI-2E family transporter [Phenylobacterium sp.]|uniref:AI-2E family transporter n=1 Tax=Phenylobacterium sp. TaxID=1871053 RepID=UPI002A365419|nr:AI-2E family transporter [Phenylobacterium sp.]MDX9997947.1 AI-2E family transporter [Phenylobacterium sp.]